MNDTTVQLETSKVSEWTTQVEALGLLTRTNSGDDDDAERMPYHAIVLVLSYRQEPGSSVLLPTSYFLYSGFNTNIFPSAFLVVSSLIHFMNKFEFVDLYSEGVAISFGLNALIGTDMCISVIVWDWNQARTSCSVI